MTCGMTPCCRQNDVLAFTLELQVEPVVRLREVTKELVPFKWWLRSRHLSMNLVYPDEGVVKQMNVGAYVVEDDAAFRVKLLFPEGVSVNILEEGGERAVNYLEYRVDKQTEVVTETGRWIDESAKGVGAIVLELYLDLALEAESIVDFTKPEFLDSVSAQVALISDWNKPVILRFAVKEEIGSRYSSDYYCLAEGLDFGRPREGMLTIRTVVPESELSQMLDGNVVTVKIDLATNVVSVGVSNYKDQNVLFLAENGDRIMNTADLNASLKGTCVDFEKQMKAGNCPALYLKTSRSGGYYPAYYVFNEAVPKAGAVPTKIGCLYVKEVDGKKVLVVDEILSSTGIVHGAMLTYNYSEIPLE